MIPSLHIHKRPLVVLAVCASLLAVPATSFAAPCPDANSAPGSVSKKRFERATACLVNKQRSKDGLRKLRLQKRLSKAARSHARDMVRKRYFSHTSRAGRDVVSRLYRLGYMRGTNSWLVGENLAWGAGGTGTPHSIVTGWMNSPGHAANILEPSFREMGIGVVFGAPQSTRAPAATYANTFGFRR